MDDRHQDRLAGLVVEGMRRAQDAGKVRGGVDLEALLAENLGHSLLEAANQVLPLLPFLIGSEDQGGVKPPVSMEAAAAVQNDRRSDGKPFKDPEGLLLGREILGLFLMDAFPAVDLNPDPEDGGGVRPGATLSRFGFRPLKSHAHVHVGDLLQLADLECHVADFRGMVRENTVRLGPHDEPAVRRVIACLKIIVAKGSLVERPS